MAGHSHWAGIKHKKGRADKERSKIFSKLSREITVAAKLGDKNPDMNPRLRTAIQAAKQANMPKDNISRAISKSEMAGDKNYENLRYEGFGPSNVALIIETLTDNKNRSASSIRTVLQKNGGRLGESGSTSHLFSNCGIIHIDKNKINEDEIFDITINAGAKDCVSLENIFEIVTEKEDFYKIKTELEKKIEIFNYSAIEWRPLNYLDLNKDQSKQIAEVLTSLEELDDVQNIFTNANFKKFTIMKIIGIDPGLSGAIAVLENNKVLNIFDMPVMSEGKKNKRQLNSALLVNLLRENINPAEEIAVVVEQVNAMPGQGVTSMFNFGQTFGAIKGVCAALDLPIFFVRPSKWKKHFELINSSKDSSRTKAIEMYPKLSNQLSKKKDVNKSDAILIARFFNETRFTEEN